MSPPSLYVNSKVRLPVLKAISTGLINALKHGAASSKTTAGTHQTGQTSNRSISAEKAAAKRGHRTNRSQEPSCGWIVMSLELTVIWLQISLTVTGRFAEA
jgi:hypothetical protein